MVQYFLGPEESVEVTQLGVEFSWGKVETAHTSPPFATRSPYLFLFNIWYHLRGLAK